MLYVILKPLVRVALRLWFRHIHSDRLEYIEQDRPCLILANHTASFMDGILLACFLERRIHFFVRGDVFSHPWADKILRSIGLLPVYRLSEGREKLPLNDVSNEEAMNILSRGGAVLIFCEGISDVVRRLKPLKKGPFRLAANATAHLSVPPVIVPLGINYVSPTRPAGDAFLVAGTPLEPSDFLEGKDEPALAKAATRLMRATNDSLKSLVWHLDYPEKEPAADRVLHALQQSANRLHFSDTHRRISELNQGKVGVELYEMPAIRAQAYFLFVLTAPLAFAGWLWHFTPLFFALKLSDSKVESPDFYAPVLLSAAMAFTTIWYLIACLLLAIFKMHILYWAALPVAALCGIWYLKFWKPVAKRLFKTSPPIQ